jgi:hypothetical protein
MGWVVSFTLRPTYPRKRVPPTHWIGGCVGKSDNLSNYYSQFYQLLQVCTVLDSFHWSCNSLLFQVEFIIFWISEHNILPPAWTSSVGIWSVPGDFYLFSLSIAISTSKYWFIYLWPSCMSNFHLEILVHLLMTQLYEQFPPRNIGSSNYDTAVCTSVLPNINNAMHIRFRQKCCMHFLFLPRVPPCQHIMVHHRVEDEGNRLQKWRVITNMLNKQSRRAEKGWS